MEKIHTQALTGCVYGFIDVPEGATGLLLVANSKLGVGPPTQSRLDRYYSEATPQYNTVFASATTLQALPGTATDFATDTLPRRALVRFGGGIYQFGKSAGETKLYRIVLPERTTTTTGTTSFLNQAKIEIALDLPEFASAVVRDERSSETSVVSVMYVGSLSTGKVYRWDGATFSTETSGLTSKRHIVATYQEDVYAICGDAMRQRKNNTWTPSISLGTTGFVPNAATEYLSKLYIVGKATVLSYDGASVADLSAAFAAAANETPISIVDVKPFNGKVYFLFETGSITRRTEIIRYDGSTFTSIGFLGSEGPNNPGCLEPSGDKLWFTAKNKESSPATIRLYYVDLSNGINDTGLGPTDNSETVPADMVAF